MLPLVMDMNGHMHLKITILMEVFGLQEMVEQFGVAYQLCMNLRFNYMDTMNTK
jgi:hypothetical protein